MSLRHSWASLFAIKTCTITFFPELTAESESEESVDVADELLLDTEGILSFCCLTFDDGDLLFFDI